MITNEQFYAIYNDYDVIATGMSEKLLKAQKNNPTLDFSAQLDVIQKVRKLQCVYHQMYHDLLSKDNESGKIMIEREKLMRKIAALEKENEELKENIRL